MHEYTCTHTNKYNLIQKSDVYVCFSHMYACVYICAWCPQRSEEVIGACGTKVQPFNFFYKTNTVLNIECKKHYIWGYERLAIEGTINI